ncbi:hypothetical protein OHA70_22875 [Kribbella sp. NBC_00382]|uniref:hypothetical protein n=1 Tax=Kribbella sp. NBC_00382 TaxID=2975967 RepID=UPI002E235084
MSRSKPVDNVAALPMTLRPGWWSQYEEELRIQATVSDLYFDLAACPDREEFAVLPATFWRLRRNLGGLLACLVGEGG